MAIRDEARVLEIVEGAQTDQWRPTLCSVDFGERAHVGAGRLVTGAVTQTRSTYGVFITEG